MSDSSEDLRLFVTLDVRPEAFASYLEAMRAEAAGARGEAGNLGFDLFGEAGRPHVLHLLEHWADRAALERDHARQPYYVHVRALEAQALTGEVRERALEEAEPKRPRSGKTIGGGRIRMRILKAADARRLPLLDRAFAEAAGALRETPGLRALSLFRNPGEAAERLLLEAWEDEAAREAGWAGEAARALTGILEEALWTEDRELLLIDLGEVGAG